MSMRVDEAWQHHAAGDVESLRMARRRMSRNLSLGADGDDQPLGDEDGTIFYNSYVGKRSATARSAAT